MRGYPDHAKIERTIVSCPHCDHVEVVGPDYASASRQLIITCPDCKAAGKPMEPIKVLP